MTGSDGYEVNVEGGWITMGDDDFLEISVSDPHTHSHMVEVTPEDLFS